MGVGKGNPVDRGARNRQVGSGGPGPGVQTGDSRGSFADSRGSRWLEATRGHSGG